MHEALWVAAGLARGDGTAALRTLRAAELDDVADAAETNLHTLIATAWTNGWQPAELARHGRRADPWLGKVIARAIAADLTQRDPSTLHPAWAAQAADVAGGLHVHDGWLADLIVRDAPPGVHAYMGLVKAVGLVAHLGRLPTVLPPPGSDPSTWHRSDDAGGDDAVEDAVLAKVRALLAQAESTTFEAEAETFTAKAQELMAKHSIDAALLWSQRGRSERPSSIRLAVDDPYISEKALLLGVVAASSRCKVVQHSDLGLYSVFGFTADLAAVELLYTSLLVQSQSAMRAEAATAPPGSHVRGASFKRAFLFGYAGRIGERLESVNRSAEDAASDTPHPTNGAPLPAGSDTATSGGSLLPVLAARGEAIDEEIAEQIGATTSTRLGGRSYDRLGWDRGGQAADRAELNPAVRAPRPAGALR